jgi:hypothetical protein
MRWTTERAIDRPSCSSRRARRIANSSPPRRKALPPWRRRAATCAKTSSPVGCPQRSLICLKSSMSRRQNVSGKPSSCARSRSCWSRSWKWGVAEPGERIGEREAHRPERTLHRALIERDGDERADESRGEKRGALPEDGQHQADRGHDRERHRRRAKGVPEERQERLLRPARDDPGGQNDVGRIEGGAGQEDLASAAWLTSANRARRGTTRGRRRQGARTRASTSHVASGLS